MLSTKYSIYFEPSFQIKQIWEITQANAHFKRLLKYFFKRCSNEGVMPFDKTPTIFLLIFFGDSIMNFHRFLKEFVGP